MSILNTSVSGMSGDQNWLSSISQNVANATTTGYKDRRHRLFDHGRPGRQRDHRGRRRTDEHGLAELAPGQHRVIADGDQSRGPGLGILRRLRFGWQPLFDPQRIIRPRRLRQPGQRLRLLPDGGQHPEWPIRLLQFAEQPAEGQRRKLRPDSGGNDIRFACGQSAFDGDGDHLCGADQHNGGDLHRSDVACRLRQPRRGAHRQSLFHEHWRQYLGGRRLSRGRPSWLP